MMNRQEFLNHLLQTYQLVTVLADKNDCRVLRLRHKTLQKDIAVRLYAQSVEAYDLLIGVKADCLPEIYDVIALSDGQAVLEEFIRGATVGDLLLSEQFRYRGAARILRQVCFALSILHQKNLVHRDVKPENVMLTPTGRVVLLDLNAARQLSQNTQDTVIMGTVGYAPPEQFGISQSDARADIYAVGVMLNVMLTGRHPSEQLADGCARHIVRKCTRVNPNDRYQTAERLARAL